MTTEARRAAIRAEFGAGTVARTLLDELEKVEASVRAELPLYRRKPGCFTASVIGSKPRSD